MAIWSSKKLQFIEATERHKFPLFSKVTFLEASVALVSNSRKRGFVKEGNFDTEAKSCFWKLDFDRGFFVARKTGMGNGNKFRGVKC